MTFTLDLSAFHPAAWPWWSYPLAVYFVTSLLIRVTGGRRGSPLMVDNAGRPDHMSYDVFAWTISPAVAAGLLVKYPAWVALWAFTVGLFPAPWTKTD